MQDGSTTKLLIKLHDGQLVESVIMRYALPLRARHLSLQTLVAAPKASR